MKEVIKDEEIGEITYEESFWTGKKLLYINGTQLEKTSKTTFRMQNGETATIKGGYLQGATLLIGARAVKLTQSVKWYEIILSILPFLFIMVWGNVVALCAIVPVVGGAIGGAISGAIGVLNLFIIKGVKQIWLKILISIVAFGICFLICFGIGSAILAAIQNMA